MRSSVLKHLCENDQYTRIIRLSSISSKHLAFAKAGVRYKRATNIGPGGDKDVDALVRMLDSGREEGGLEMLAGASDQPQLLLTCGRTSALKLKFTAHDKDMLCTIQSAVSRRFLMQYCDGLHLVGTGTFGAVFGTARNLSSSSNNAGGGRKRRR